MEQQDLLERSPRPIRGQILQSLYKQDAEQFIESVFEPIKMKGWSKNSSKTSTASDRSDIFFFQEDQYFGELQRNPFILEVDEGEQSNPCKSIQIHYSEMEVQELKVNRTVLKRVQKNKDRDNISDETKNIPKNYIKAIYNFILSSPGFLKRLFHKINSDKLQFAHLSSSQKIQFLRSQQEEFNMFIKIQKRIKRYTIERLKELWMHERFGKMMRMVSIQFLRKRSLTYVFQSKIQLKMSHVKHRNRLIQALSDPLSFKNIKL